VKTRTLLLLATACGLMIMIAGAVFLVQLSTQDEALPPAVIGEPTQVGDMRVTVVGASEGGGLLTVEVELGGTEDDQPADEFRLIASGRAARAVSSTCGATTTSAAQACELAFDVSGADGDGRVLFYARGEDQARWVLA
jgi:hypothetical protein